MVKYDQLFSIEMITKCSEQQIPKGCMSTALEASLKKLLNLENDSIMRYKECWSFGEYVTSNCDRDSFEYFGHLNNQNRNKYWHKVMDVLSKKATDNSLVFMNPNSGLWLSGSSKILLHREDYVILEEVLGIRNPLQNTTIAYSQNLGEIACDSKSYFETLKGLFGTSVIFTGSLEMGFGIVILPSIEKRDVVIGSIVRFYEDHDLDLRKEVFLLSK